MNHIAVIESAIAISDIRADDRCQPRATFDNDLVSQYAEGMANGDKFPPVTVFHDGVDYFLADGFHRYHAAKSLGLVEIAATVKEGTLRDAILHSCSANANHGWRRTNDDKRRAVLRLLNDAEWSKWSDREIARQCNVSAPMVATLRPKPPVTVNSYSEPDRTYTTKHGTTSTMRTANIGTAPRPQSDAPVFDATPSGERWQDTGSPEAVAEISNANRETHLTNAVWDIVRKVGSLPDARDAGRRFPSMLFHTLNEAELLHVSAWFVAFAAEIKVRKEVPNVAAE